MQGYPSIGDAHSTVPVPKEKWYDYAGERSGRFQVRQFSIPDLARSRPIAATLLHAVLCNPPCGAEQCHRSCHHSDACESPGPGADRADACESPGADRALTGMAWLAQGLTNADGSIKTECGIHNVTEEVAGEFHRGPHSSDPLEYFNCLLLELISPMQLDRHFCGV